ncbi:MAG TPA: hypothetical protein VF258_10680, partial [Luteolibacter sp.]
MACFWLLLAAPYTIFAQTVDDLKPLKSSLDVGGLPSLESRLAEGISWPRITSDFRAANEMVDEERQRNLVILAEGVMEQLRSKAHSPLPGNEEDLKKEAALLYSLGDRFWKSGGYRNQVLALISGEL